MLPDIAQHGYNHGVARPLFTAFVVVGLCAPLGAETTSAFATQIRADLALLSAEPTLASWQKSHHDGKLDLAHYETGREIYELDFERLNRWCAASVSHFSSDTVRAAMFYVPSPPQGTLPLTAPTKESARVGACRLQAIWVETTEDIAITALVNDLASSWGRPDGQTTTPDIAGSGLWKDVVAWHRNGINIWAVYNPKGTTSGSAPPSLAVYVRRDMPRDPPSLAFWLLPDSIRYEILDAAAHLAAQSAVLTNSILERSRCVNWIPQRESERVAVDRLAKWLAASEGLSPARRAASLVLADVYMRCSSLDPKRLRPLGAKFTTHCPQDGPAYDGNFVEKARELDPNGPAGELAELVALGMPCSLKGNRPWPDLAIAKGEKLLTEVSPGKWTPWIYFVIARARAAKLADAYPGGNPEGEVVSFTPSEMGADRKATIRRFEEFLGAMPQAPETVFAWQETWRLMAGLPPSQGHFGCGCE